MIAALVLTVFLFCLPAPLSAQTLLEDFQEYPESSYPVRWRARHKQAQAIYQIASEGGNRYLRARADGQGVQIALMHSIDPRRQPQLHWRWRVHKFPQGADERVGAKHDAAAQLYVVFDNQYYPRVIKYIWSETLPVGLRFSHPLYSRGHVVVLRSGSGEIGKWQAESINFYEDYKRLFGAEPGMVQGIAVLTASDSTRSSASADYDDFVIY
jgi:hypothetical protein